MSGDNEFSRLLEEIAAAPAELPLSMQPPLPRRLGRYRLVERIGQGGMGVVYAALDQVLRREVAVKLPGASCQGAQCQRLLSEARRAAAFDHPNIAKVYDAGEVDGEAFIAMEYVRGETLRATIQRGPMPEVEAFQLLLPIARALAHTHERGIVHRDLKPENVMVEPGGGVKVLDFGLAQPAASREARTSDELVGTSVSHEVQARATTVDVGSTTSQGSMGWEQRAGTPGYMSPEQQAASAVGCAADVFAFGVIAHELMTGRAPEQGATMAAGASHGWSPAAQAFVSSCLAVSDAERPRDGATLEATLLTLLGRTTARKSRRRPAVSLLAAALFAAGGIWLSLPRATESRPERSNAVVASPGKSGSARLAATNESTDHRSYLSPSGQKLTFVDERGLMLLDLSTGARQRLLPPEARVAQAHWLPGEREVVLLIDSGHLPGTLERLDLTTLKRTPLAATVNNEFALSPDGKRLASVVDEGQLELSSLAADSPPAILAAPGAIPGGPLSWSPDGQWVAMHDSIRVPSAIVAIHVQTGELRTLVQHGGLHTQVGAAAFTWHANWQLTYQQIDDGTGSLSTARVDPQTLRLSPARRISEQPVSVVWLQGSAASDRIVYHQYAGRERVLGARLSGPGRLDTPLVRLTHRDVDEFVAGWLPGHVGLRTTLDGQPRLALVSLEDGSLTPWLQPGDETGTALALGTRGFLFYRRQSPHDSQIWYQPDAEGAASRRIADFPELGDSSYVHYCAARVGRCFRAHFVAGTWQIAELSLADGSRREALAIPGVLGDAMAISPDAQSWAVGRLAVTLDPSVRFYDGHGQLTSSADLPEGCFAQYMAFSPDGSGAYAAGMCTSSEPYQLFFVSRAGHVQALGAKQTGWLHDLAVSPDGRWLVVNVRTDQSEMWTLDLPRAAPPNEP